ncbi:hypothetical protein CH286_05225 [Rhodococcus sp. WWJCD1]|nr:hypothetical protein CH286_05225 [Rhodococcus sp. WWJCD1]
MNDLRLRDMKTSFQRNQRSRYLGVHHPGGTSTRSDVLVLSVGGLTREGTFFPSSGMFANALFDDPDPLNGWHPDHVPAVVLHDQEKNRSRWLYGREPWMGR